MSQSGYSQSTDLERWLSSITGPMPGTGARVMDRPVRLFHSVNVPVAGTQRITFFTESRSDFISNLDTPNQIPPNSALALEGIAFEWAYGYDRLGLALGIAAPSAAELRAAQLFNDVFTAAAAAGTATPIAALAAEMSARFLGQAQVTFSIKNQEIFTMKGLHTFPQGKGMVETPSAAVTSNSTTTGITASANMRFTNGVPVIQNMFRFPQPYPMPGGQTFQLEVEWPNLAAVAWNTATVGPLNGLGNAVTAGTLTAELIGRYGTPQ